MKRKTSKATPAPTPHDFVLVDIKPERPDRWNARCFSFEEEIRFDSTGNTTPFRTGKQQCFAEWFQRARKVELDEEAPAAHDAALVRLRVLIRERLRKLGYKRFAYTSEDLCGEDAGFGIEEL